MGFLEVRADFPGTQPQSLQDALVGNDICNFKAKDRIWFSTVENGKAGIIFLSSLRFLPLVVGRADISK